MTDRQKEIINKVGLNQNDFKPSDESVTIEDLVEALDILTEIVLGGTE